MMYLGINMLSGVPPIESTGMQQVIQYRETDNPNHFTPFPNHTYSIPDYLIIIPSDKKCVN